ncbi:MAG: hypothetical protein R3A10_19445 [Caldilineaceae bacterium]
MIVAGSAGQQAGRGVGASAFTHTIKRHDDPVATVLGWTDGMGAGLHLCHRGQPQSHRTELRHGAPGRYGGHRGHAAQRPDAHSPQRPPLHLRAHHHRQGNMGSTRLLVDIPRLVELYKAGRLKLDELITKRYRLEEINEAIESMERGEALRNVIIFDA